MNDDAKRRAHLIRCHTRIRGLVTRKQYQITGHVEDKLRQNQWTLQDLLQSIIGGEVTAIEVDEYGVAIDKKKYAIEGVTNNGYLLGSVGKIILEDNVKKYRVITAYPPF